MDIMIKTPPPPSIRSKAQLRTTPAPNSTAAADPIVTAERALVCYKIVMAAMCACVSRLRQHQRPLVVRVPNDSSILDRRRRNTRARLHKYAAAALLERCCRLVGTARNKNRSLHRNPADCTA